MVLMAVTSDDRALVDIESQPKDKNGWREIGRLPANPPKKYYDKSTDGCRVRLNERGSRRLTQLDIDSTGNLTERTA